MAGAGRDRDRTRLRTPAENVKFARPARKRLFQQIQGGGPMNPASERLGEFMSMDMARQETHAREPAAVARGRQGNPRAAFGWGASA